MIELFATADTAVLELEPDFNLGADADLPSGTLGPPAGITRSRLLIRFDLSTLPEGAMIQSAVFQCTVTREPGEPADSIFALHRMLNPWSEGRGMGPAPGGSAAQSGETTWNERLAGAAAWGGPGGLPGEDFSETSSGSERIQGSGTYNLEIGAAGLEDLRDWMSDPTTNHGWMLRSETEEVFRTARRFASREASLNPPRLVIQYTAPTAPRISGLAVSPAGVVLRFDAEAGVPYSWEERPSIASGTWVTILDIPATVGGGSISVTNLVPPGDTGFSRLRVGP